MSLPNCYYKRFARLMLPLNYHFVSEIYNTTMDPGNFFPSFYYFSLLLQFVAPKPSWSQEMQHIHRNAVNCR